MSAQLSNEITHCVRTGRHLLSAFTIEGPRVAASFLEETESHLEEGDAEPRPDGLLVAIERKLRAALGYLVETDHAVAAAVSLESELRQRHRADKRQLAFLIVALRRMVLAQYIKPDMDNLGLQPVNVRDGATITRRAELIGQRFEAPNLTQMLGKSRFEKPADLSRFVAEIRAGAAKLFTLMGEINEAHRAADRARINRDRAKEAYDRVYLRGARMFEDMCRFAGLDELADRIRRRKSRPAVAAAVETTAVEPVAVEPVAVEPVAVEMEAVEETASRHLSLPTRFELAHELGQDGAGEAQSQEETAQIGGDRDFSRVLLEVAHGGSRQSVIESLESVLPATKEHQDHRAVGFNVEVRRTLKALDNPVESYKSFFMTP